MRHTYVNRWRIEMINEDKNQYENRQAAITNSPHLMDQGHPLRNPDRLENFGYRE